MKRHRHIGRVRAVGFGVGAGRRRISRLLAAVAVVTWMTGCDGPTEEVGSPAPTDLATSAAPTPTPEAPDPSAAADEETTTVEPDDAINAAIQALADREGVAAARVSVVEVERSTWPDGALGCPEPGGVYTQAIESGYRVLLSVDEDRFDYRISDRGSVRRCDQPLRSRLRPGPSAGPAMER